MKIKKLTSIILVAALAAATAPTLVGCMTSQVQTPGPKGTTTTVTVVNTNNLALDASALQAVTATTVSLVVAKYPSTTNEFRTAHIILDGVINGSNPQTTAQVLSMLKASSNPVLASEISSLIGSLSAAEQTLLQKYGAEVAGQIALALARAVDAGIVVGISAAPVAVAGTPPLPPR